MGLFRKKKPPARTVDIDQALTAVPGIWDDVEARPDSRNLLQVRRILRPRSRLEGFFARTFNFRKVIRVNLDDQGTAFWTAINGRRPLSEISKRLAGRFRLEPHLADQATIVFTRNLMLRHLIYLKVPHEPPGTESGSPATRNAST
jgi:hypothetical protein